MSVSPDSPSDPNLLRQRHLDQACDRFELAWKAIDSAAEPPCIEDFLSDSPESERQVLTPELISLDVYYRRRSGEDPLQQAYSRRFPSLDPAWLAKTMTLPGLGEIMQAGHAEPAVATRKRVSGSGSNERESEPLGTVREFGDYELLAEIARGGMGVVYRARQRSLQRIVALKMIRAGELASEAEIQRFHVEAEAAANLDHPGIVPIYEVGQHAGQHYFSMGYVEGDSLAARVAFGPLPPRLAAELVREVAQAVQYAHEQGVIHRDLKPANILLDRTGRPRVTDFGLAKRVASDSNLTLSGQVIGTPSYMPPEQAAGHADQIGPLADVYALGAVLYALLTGHPPFQAATPTDTLRQVLEQDPMPLRQLNPAVPRDLETISLKCLEKSPARRYASATSLADDLDRWLASKPILARRSGVWERTVKWARRRPAVAGSLGTVLVVTLLAFGLVTSFWLNEQKAKRIAVTEQQNAEQAEREAKRLAVRLALNQGRTLCEQADIGPGMLWMAYTLQLLPPKDTDYRRAIGANLAAWRNQLRSPYALLPDAQTAVFSPHGETVLTVGPDQRVRLWQVATGDAIGPPLEHSGPVLAAIFSPSSQLVLTCTKDGRRCFWDASTGAPVGNPWKAGAAVQAATFSPDGATAVTVSQDGRIRSWETTHGKLLREGVAEGPVQAVAFHPDSKTIMTGGSKGHVQLWDASTLEPIGTLLGPQSAQVGEVWSVQFSPPDGAVLLAAVRNEQEGTGVVQLWNSGTREHLATLQCRWQIEAVAFSPDGKTVVTGNADFTAQLWDVATGQPRPGGYLQHEDRVGAVAFSPDGQSVLTGSHDRTARRWNTLTGEPSGSPLEHPAPVVSVAFSPPGQTIATVSREPAVRLWQAFVDLPEHGHYPQASEVMALAVSPQGCTLAIGTTDGTVRVYELANGEEVAHFSGHTDEIWALAYAPNGKHLLTASPDGTVRVWDPTNPQAASTILPHDFRVRTVAVSPDSRKILTGSGNAADKGVACLWDMPTNQTVTPPQKLTQDGVVWAVAFGRNRDGQTFAIASGEDKLRLWKNVRDWSQLPSGIRLRSVHQSRAVALAFSPDGQFLLSGSTDKTAQLWTVSDAAPIGKPLRHASAVWAVAFSIDGRTLVTGCRDGSVRLWDAATGTCIGPAWQHQGTVWSVACDPDGQTVWSGGDDQTVRRWRLPGIVVGDAERIRLWVQVITGMQFDQNQVAEWLDAATWQRRRQELQQRGGPPLP